MAKQVSEVEVVVAFSHADADQMHGQTYAPGRYAVGTRGAGAMSARCAEVALMNGWAKPAKGKNPTRSPRSGKTKPPSSPPPGPASGAGNSSGSGAPGPDGEEGAA